MILLLPTSTLFPYTTLFRSVVFVPKQFWSILNSLPKGQWAGILWDDPTKGLQKRDWYKEVNKAVTSFAKTASRYRQRDRSEEHTSELQSQFHLVCRLLLEKK